MMEISVTYRLGDEEEKILQSLVDKYQKQGIHFTKETAFDFIMRTGSLHDMKSKMQFHEEMLDSQEGKKSELNYRKENVSESKQKSVSKSAYNIVMDSRKELVERLIEQMEKGYAQTRAAWSHDGLGRPYNPLSNAVYRGGNRFRLMLEAQEKGFKDPRWLTFKQASENNMKIKPGSKGVMLEKWIFYKEVPVLDEKQQPVSGDDGKPVKELKRLDKPQVNYFWVFNGEQVEGLPELQKNTLTEDMYSKMADTFERSSKCPIHFGIENQAFYSPIKDEIHMPTKEAFKSNQARLAVQLHEMAHSTGHPDRLNRPLGNKFGSVEYAKEELNAELSSIFLESELGIELDTDSEALKDHSNYVKSWIAVLKDNPNEFFNACNVAEKVTDYLKKNYELTLQMEQIEEQQMQEQVKVQEEPENKLVEVAIESTNDYTEPGFYGKMHERFRIVKISENGNLEPINDKTYESLKEAQQAINPVQYIEENYDRMVYKAFIAKSFHKQIEQDIKESGFKPTDNLIKNIKEFVRLEEKVYTLKEIIALREENPDFSGTPKKAEHFNNIIKECQEQIQEQSKTLVNIDSMVNEVHSHVRNMFEEAVSELEKTGVWGNWNGIVVNHSNPKEYFYIGMTGMENSQEILMDVTCVKDNRKIAAENYSVKALDIWKTGTKAFDDKHVEQMLKDSLEKGNFTVDAASGTLSFDVYSTLPGAESPKKHYQMLTEQGKHSWNYDEIRIHADIQKSGFNPTESLVENIYMFSEMEGKDYTMRELAELHKQKPDFSNDPKKEECFKSIIMECQEQELAKAQNSTHFIKQEMAMEITPTP